MCVFARWFYGVFVDLFKGKIKDAFTEALQQQVTAAISDINKQYEITDFVRHMVSTNRTNYYPRRYVASFPVKTAVNDVVGINYGLVYEPINPYITSYGAVTNHVGMRQPSLSPFRMHLA
jgi:hypothetical protein